MCGSSMQNFGWMGPEDLEEEIVAMLSPKRFTFIERVLDPLLYVHDLVHEALKGL